MNVQYCFAEGVDTEWCAVNPEFPHRTLCARRVSRVPVVQPAFSPDNLHAVCREALWGRKPAEVEMPPDVLAQVGDCPVCGGSVDLDAEGLVVAHEQHVMRSGRQVVSETACDGAGLKPEAEA